MNTAIESTRPLDKQVHRKKQIKDYYRETTLDYKYWSKNLNMHFGYWKWPMNPFDRESMLEEMNNQVSERMVTKPEGLYLDLGCGVGRTAKWIGDRYPELSITGVTLCPEQVSWGKELFGDDHPIVCRDYEKLSLEEDSIDGVCFVESLCHAVNKKKLLENVYKWLKPGSKLVISDGFLMKNPLKTTPYLKRCYDTVCDYWAVPDFCNYKETLLQLYQAGFEIEHIEEPSWRVGVSALHSPFLVLYCWLRESIRNENFGTRRRQHLIAVLASVFMGMHRKFFRYHIISVKKPA